MKISVLIPSIRPRLLQGVYNSLEKSCNGISFELVIISPYALPESLSEKTNIIYIKDFGTPIRGRQMGLIAATGDYICYAADDVVFCENSLKEAYETLKGKDYKTLVVGKYMEGEVDNPAMQADSYWYLATHDFLRPTIPADKQGYFLINTGLISRELMLEVGGFDCSFEACAMACCDLSVRLQNYGATCLLQNNAIFHATHLPGERGDHKPINDGQTQHDMPKFLVMYLNNFNRTLIQLDNWRDASDHWVRRFGAK